MRHDSFTKLFSSLLTFPHVRFLITKRGYLLIVFLFLVTCVLLSGCETTISLSTNTSEKTASSTSTKLENQKLVAVSFSYNSTLDDAGQKEIIVQINGMETGELAVQKGYMSAVVIPTIHTEPGTTYIVELNSTIGSLGKVNVVWDTISGERNFVTEQHGLAANLKTIIFSTPGINPYLEFVKSWLKKPVADRGKLPSLSIKVYKYILVTSSTHTTSLTPSTSTKQTAASSTTNTMVTSTQNSTLIPETTIIMSLTTGDDGDSTTWEPTQIRGQMWTTASSFRLSYIDIFMRKVGQPGNAVLVVKMTDGNNPIGQELSKTVVTANSIPISNSWVRFNVSGIDILAGKTYWWGIYAESGSSSTDYYAIRYDAQNGFQQGKMWNSSQGIGHPFTQYDDLFKIYGQLYK